MKPFLVISAGVITLGTGIVIDQNVLVALGALVTTLSGLYSMYRAQRASMMKSNDNFTKIISDFVEVVTDDNANLRKSLIDAQKAILESDRQRQELREELMAARIEIAEATRINKLVSSELAQVQKSLEDCLKFRQQLQAKE